MIETFKEGASTESLKAKGQKKAEEFTTAQEATPRGDPAY